MTSKRQIDGAAGRKKRQRIIDIINEKDCPIHCDFVYGEDDSNKSLVIRCQTTDEVKKEAMIEMRVEAYPGVIKRGFFKYSRIKEENIALAKERIFVLVAAGKFCVLPGWEIPDDKFSQSKSPRNETRLDIDLSDYIPETCLHGTPGWIYNKNIAEALYDVLNEMK